MSNAGRPSLQRVHTRTTEKQRDDALNAGVKLTIDDEVYEARIGDVTAQIARELRAATGSGFVALMNTVAEDPDVDVISAFVWVARRIKGEHIAFEDVEITYAQILGDGFDVDVAGAEEVDAEDPQT